VQGASLLFQVFAQPVEISVIVFLAKEAGSTVVSALDDVQRHTIKMYTGATGHPQTLAEIFEPGPFNYGHSNSGSKKRTRCETRNGQDLSSFSQSVVHGLFLRLWELNSALTSSLPTKALDDTAVPAPTAH
jgi:hypothetical protein